LSAWTARSKVVTTGDRMAVEHQRCVIVGAGPAGLSAALWLDKLGVPFVLLEAGAQLGGELWRINLPIRDLLGVQAGSGRDFIARVQQQLASLRWDLRFGAAVRRIDPAQRRVETATGALQADALLLTMGLRRRALELPDAAGREGRGLSYSATTDAASLAGQRVLVLGGGDGAFENALFLAERCPQVWLAHRGPRPSARAEFVQRAARAARAARLEVIADAELRAIAPQGDALAGVELNTARGPRTLEASWVVIKIGFVPRTETLPADSPARDAAGYLVVDRCLATSVPGVFAAGDLCNPHAPSLAAAIGDGAVAASAIQRALR
jgi:thioredoxin reductase (NADPH)